MEARHMGHILRALRAAVFAAVCVLLAALGHAMMSGSAVPWWTIASALLVTGGAAWCLAGRERGPLLVTAATVGAQAALHTAFSFAQRAAAGAGVAAHGGHPATHGGTGHRCGSLLSASPAADSPGGLTGGHPGGHAQHTAHAAMPGHHMTMPGMDPSATDLPGAAMPGMDMAGMHHGHGALAMWSAHVLVALVCGIWLSGGEQAAYRLGRTLAVRLFAPLIRLFRARPTAAQPPRVRGARRRDGQRLRRLLLTHVLATRGPPLGSAVL